MDSHRSRLRTDPSVTVTDLVGVLVKFMNQAKTGRLSELLSPLAEWSWKSRPSAADLAPFAGLAQMLVQRVPSLSVAGSTLKAAILAQHADKPCLFGAAPAELQADRLSLSIRVLLSKFRDIHGDPGRQRAVLTSAAPAAHDAIKAVINGIRMPVGHKMQPAANQGSESPGASPTGDRPSKPRPTTSPPQEPTSAEEGPPTGEWALVPYRKPSLHDLPAARIVGFWVHDTPSSAASFAEPAADPKIPIGPPPPKVPIEPPPPAARARPRGRGSSKPLAEAREESGDGNGLGGGDFDDEQLLKEAAALPPVPPKKGDLQTRTRTAGGPTKKPASRCSTGGLRPPTEVGKEGEPPRKRARAASGRETQEQGSPRQVQQGGEACKPKLHTHESKHHVFSRAYHRARTEALRAGSTAADAKAAGREAGRRATAAL